METFIKIISVAFAVIGISLLIWAYWSTNLMHWSQGGVVQSISFSSKYLFHSNIDIQLPAPLPNVVYWDASQSDFPSNIIGLYCQFNGIGKQFTNYSCEQRINGINATIYQVGG